MKTTQDKLNEAQTRHIIYLLRWSKGTYRKHLNIINKAFSDMSYRLQSGAPADGSFTAKRLEMMLGVAEETSKRLYKALNDLVNDDYRELAAYEAAFQVRAVSSAYPIALDIRGPTPAQIHAAAMSQPFQGKVLGTWWRDQSVSLRSHLSQQIRLGYVEGETISQVVRRIGDVEGMTKRNIEAVVRTATNHMADMARRKTTEANDWLFSHEEWSSTLDGRTSPICIERDGKRYKVGSGPRPPAHFNCRSVRVPVTKSWKELGFDGMDEDEKLNTRPFVLDKRRVKDIPKSERDSLIGRTTAKTYSEFAKSQPLSFLEDVAGDYRAKLVKDGGLELKDLIRNGQWMTIDQIEKSESKALKSAVATVNAKDA